MKKAVSVDIMFLLNGAGLSLTTGNNLAAMAWLDDVDEQVLIMDTTGPSSPLKKVYEQPTFQILVRGAKKDDINTAYATMRGIHEFLIAQSSQDIDGTGYLEFEPLSTIEGLGRDDNDRAIFTMNYYTFRDPI